MTDAPLTIVPEAPAPEGGSAFWYKGADGARLRAAVFKPKGEALGSVILSPGRTEPIEKYFEVVGELLGRGFVVLVHDWRGQGLSARALPDRLKGHAKGYGPFLSDFNILLTSQAERLPKPWIAMAHSMGGGLTTLALAKGEKRFDAAILSAPMVGLNSAGRSVRVMGLISRVMVLVGRGGAYLAPSPDPLQERFEDNVVTHDAGRYARARAQLVANPDLKLGGITWGWLRFALDLLSFVHRPNALDRLAIPFVIVGAEEEKLCDNTASKAVAARVPKGRYVEAPGAYHEVLMEIDPRRAHFWAEFDALAATVAPAR